MRDVDSVAADADGVLVRRHDCLPEAPHVVIRNIDVDTVRNQDARLVPAQWPRGHNVA